MAKNIIACVLKEEEQVIKYNLEVNIIQFRVSIEEHDHCGVLFFKGGIVKDKAEVGR